jgi:uncharacterized membrane protein HdeD (DUF308 family)
VGIAERLRRLDDRVLRRGKTVHFDNPKPWWFAYAGVFGAVFGMALVGSPFILDGTLRLLVFVVVLSGYVAYFIKVLRWRRRHEMPSEE